MTSGALLILAACGYYVLYALGRWIALFLVSIPEISAELGKLTSHSVKNVYDAIAHGINGHASYPIEQAVLGGAVTVLCLLPLAILLTGRAVRRKKEGRALVGIGGRPIAERCTLHEFFGIRPAAFFPLSVSFLIGIFGSFAVNLLFRLPFPSAWQMREETQTSGLFGQAPAAIVLGMVLLLPLIEEIVFRGLINSRLCDCLGPVMGILLSGVIFSLIHTGPFQMMYTFGMGILMGAMSVRSDSFLTPLMTHIGFNLVGGLEILGISPWREIGDAGRLWIEIGCAVMMTVLAAVFFSRRFASVFSAKEKKENAERKV